MSVRAALEKGTEIALEEGLIQAKHVAPFKSLSKELPEVAKEVVQAEGSIGAAAERIVDFAKKHDIQIVTGPRATKVDKVLIETLEGKSNVTSRFKLTTDEAVDAGKKWVGEGYTESKAGSGVFVSADGQRQFRIDNNSILGNHAPDVPHVHLETLAPGQKYPIVNNHIPFQD